MSAKETILARVRAALRDVGDAERPDDVAVPRAYHRTGALSAEAMLDQFVERVSEYQASVRRVAERSLAAGIADTLTAAGIRRLIVPNDVPDDWRPEGIEVVDDDGGGHERLDRVDGVLTGCSGAIAETGTITLDSGARQGRRALTLVPDYHLCVVRADQVVASVPEGVAALADAIAEGRPITWISGPSATSDIELSRVEGVHGPRTLEVLLVE
ncbi:MAG: LutC/YkgG family protein [Egibacteraceae bacterium]